MRAKTLLACSDVPDFAKPQVWDTSHQGVALNTTGFINTFTDDFTALSVTGNTGAGPWYAPGNQKFGFGTFKPPTASPSPFSQSGSDLIITAQSVAGQWQTGHMQTMNPSGVGFSQALGYFEMRALFQNSYPAWPSFWLVGAGQITNPAARYIEIDAIEAFGGGDQHAHHASTHLWAPPRDVNPVSQLTELNLPPLSLSGPFDGAYHRYGVLVTSSLIIAYYDAVEVARRTNFDEGKMPLYMLVSLALISDPGAAAPITMNVDYVKAWSF